MKRAFGCTATVKGRNSRGDRDRFASYAPLLSSDHGAAAAIMSRGGAATRVAD